MTTSLPSGEPRDPAANTPHDRPPPLPISAILAVTLNCNARCVMCDIWQNNMKGEAAPEVFGRLPSSLKDINISGGEPFLRRDLPQIISNVKKAAPDARLVISTNGFTPDRIEETTEEILKIDSRIALRISIDGYESTHEEVRGIPRGFEKCMDTLKRFKRLGVRDLGLGFTVLSQNIGDLVKVYEVTRDEGIEFTVSLPADSSIYFGEGKEQMGPDKEELRTAFNKIIRSEAVRWNPKSVFRSWFYQSQMRYFDSGKRPYRCDAGSGFFYMDSFANIYLCHIIDHKIGNLADHDFVSLWNSGAAAEGRRISSGCHKCWMTCTSKPQIYANLPRIGLEMASTKARAHFGLSDFV